MWVQYQQSIYDYDDDVFNEISALYKNNEMEKQRNV